MAEVNELTVRWNGKDYDVSYLKKHDTVLALKELIFDLTGVRPERQKLLNLKYEGKTPPDDCKLDLLKLKPGFKVMMVGSLEKDIQSASKQPENMPEVVDDLDVEEIKLENPDVHYAKVERRIREYQVNVLNEPRKGHKLLVLDIDYTLFDHRSTAETGNELMRPYLHEFLTSAYRYYDIVIWSATGMRWIEEKMRLLGVASNPNYKIAFYLDCGAMISVHTPKYGVIEIKPLPVIWGKFPCYTPKNTIMFDDIRRNFLMNPKNGLRIRPFRFAHLTRATDCELWKLAKYLKAIANVADLTSLNHRKWERYLKDHYKKCKKRKRREKKEEERSDEDDMGNPSCDNPPHSLPANGEGSESAP